MTYKKRLRNRFVSNRGKANYSLDAKFKAATIKVPLYISNVSRETNKQDIVEYIQRKTNVAVTLEKIVAKIDRGYDSYLFYADSFRVPLFLNDEMWPEGIRFRKFVVFNKGRVSSDNRNELK